MMLVQQVSANFQHHPTLCVVHAGSIAEDPFNCEVISHEEGAIQQLILMALSDNEIVVEQACKTIGAYP